MTTLSEYNNNFAATVASERANAVFDRIEDGGRLRVIRTATGAVVPWSPPDSMDPGDSASELHKGAMAARTLTSVSNRVKAIQDDARLSDQAKADDIARAWAEGATAADRLQADVEGDIERFTAHEAAFFAPPAVTDPVQQIADMEARQWFQALHADQVPGVVHAMENGEQPALLAALMRSHIPLPHGVQQTLASAWRAHLARTKTAELRAIEGRRERLDWLRMVTAQVASAIPRPQATAPIITRQAA